MKILWFSNCKLNVHENKLSGSWLYSMSELLTKEKNIVLTNITVDRSNLNKDIQRVKIASNFYEYILPKWKLDKNGFPHRRYIQKIQEICQKETPDLIHVWGLENYFSKLVPQLNLNIPLLLEIQGLHGPCAQVFYGDLSFRDTISCLGLREILFPHLKSIYAHRKLMGKLAKQDNLTSSKYKFISTQSRWVRDYITFWNIKAQIFQTGMSIRTPFWNAQWEYPKDGQLNFYCSAAGPSPYKSIQTAIKALNQVKIYYPKCKLYVVGNFNKSNWIHQSGYLTYLYKLVQKLNLSDNVIFTGSLTAQEIVEVMKQCIAMLQTSYVESYSLALVEAQAAGIPAIISYAGAMPELAEDRKSGLFFSPGDYMSCAARMIELIKNKDLALSISRESLAIVKERNNDQAVVKTQIKIYETILKNKS